MSVRSRVAAVGVMLVASALFPSGALPQEPGVWNRAQVQNFLSGATNVCPAVEGFIRDGTPRLDESALDELRLHQIKEKTAARAHHEVEMELRWRQLQAVARFYGDILEQPLDSETAGGRNRAIASKVGSAALEIGLELAGASDDPVTKKVVAGVKIGKTVVQAGVDIHSEWNRAADIMRAGSDSETEQRARAALTNVVNTVDDWDAALTQEQTPSTVPSVDELGEICRLARKDGIERALPSIEKLTLGVAAAFIHQSFPEYFVRITVDGLEPFERVGANPSSSILNLTPERFQRIVSQLNERAVQARIEVVGPDGKRIAQGMAKLAREETAGASIIDLPVPIVFVFEHDKKGIGLHSGASFQLYSDPARARVYYWDSSRKATVEGTPRELAAGEWDTHLFYASAATAHPVTKKLLKTSQLGLE